jgi:hypothetical protein
MSGKLSALQRRHNAIGLRSGPRVTVQLRQTDAEALDKWIAEQGNPTMTRPGAIRQMIAAATGAATEPPSTVDPDASLREDP